MTHPQYFYLEHLQTINGVKFTRREIDIISFIINGRSTKKIARFYSLSPRTVENYIHNIMRKLDCNARERIIDFVEKSKKLHLLRQHYSCVATYAAFEKGLKDIALINESKHPTAFLIQEKNFRGGNVLIEQFKKDLQRAGVNVVESHDKTATLSCLTHSSQSDSQNYFLLLSSKAEVNSFLENKNASVLLNSFSGFNTKINLNEIDIILVNEKNESNKICDNKIKFIELNSKNYYNEMLLILKKISPHSDFEKIITEFHKNTEEVLTPVDENLSSSVEEKDFVKKSLPKILWLFTRKSSLLITILSPILVVGGIFCFSLMRGKSESADHSQNPVNLLVRSQLSIPAESTLLIRQHPLDQIQRKLTGSSGIQTIALIGIGGTGKTTLARQFARTQDTTVVWEINAETTESVKSSFEDLAYALCKTDEERKICREILEIKNLSEKEWKIIRFAAKQLRHFPNWVLIYDNVEKFSDIQNHFPQNSQLWGKGKVIITTRNANIQNNMHIKSMIHIAELTPKEKQELFVKIANKREKHLKINTQLQEVKKFLEYIPSFPLDIAIAAYYLKTVNITPQQYLNNLKTNDDGFSDLQEDIIKETTGYAQIRYRIIALSLKQLIEKNQDFKDLLLFISLIDSQNIPITLLTSYKSKLIVDNFNHHLQKFSFIANDGSISGTEASFSLHRSTQLIILAYLLKEGNLDQINKNVSEIAIKLVERLQKFIDNENISGIKSLLPHSKAFLDHENLLKISQRGIISIILGKLYYYLGDLTKSKQFIESGLQDLINFYDENHINLAQGFLYLGDVYRSLGNFKKSESFFEKSLAIYKKEIPKPQLKVAQVLAHLGLVCREFDNHEKAKRFLEESLLIYKNHAPKNYIDIAWASAHLGRVYQHFENYKQAKNRLEQSLSLYKKYLPKDHQKISWVSTSLAVLYRKLGEYEKAKSLLEESIHIYKKNRYDDHIEFAWSLAHLGRVCKTLGEYGNSKHYLEQSIKIYRKNLPKKTISFAWALGHLGEVHRALGNYEQALILLEEGLGIYKQHFPEKHPALAWSFVQIGNVYRDMKKYKKAKEFIEKGHVIYTTYPVKNRLRFAWVYLHLGEIYKHLGEYEKAQMFFAKSLARYEEHYGQDHLKTGHAIKGMGEVFLLKGDTETAEKFLSKALKIYKKANYPTSVLDKLQHGESQINK